MHVSTNYRKIGSHFEHQNIIVPQRRIMPTIRLGDVNRSGGVLTTRSSRTLIEHKPFARHSYPIKMSMGASRKAG